MHGDHFAMHHLLRATAVFVRDGHAGASFTCALAHIGALFYQARAGVMVAFQFARCANQTAIAFITCLLVACPWVLARAVAVTHAL